MKRKTIKKPKTKRIRRPRRMIGGNPILSAVATTAADLFSSLFK